MVYIHDFNSVTFRKRLHLYIGPTYISLNYCNYKHETHRNSQYKSKSGFDLKAYGTTFHSIAS